MIDFTDAKIEQIIIHKVGNKHREESNIVSAELTYVYDDLKKLLLKYFGKSFLNQTETYHFVHDIELKYNVLKGISTDIFSDTGSFLINSVNILNHLFEQSNHPHIKSGDLFICLFSDLTYQNDYVQALGIFKSESKDAFIKLKAENNKILIDKEAGISIKKLDKGCIIINTENEDGYRVFSVDNNRYDTEYWKNNFLNIDLIHDDNFSTQSYLDLCKTFASEVVAENAGKKEQVDFLNETVKYFEKNEVIDTEDFTNSLFENEQTKESFNEFKKQYEKANNFEFSDNFERSEIVYKKQKRKFKNFIKLDTNIQIKLDFNNPESTEKFIEKGYDEEKEMYFYKVFFNTEV